MTQKEIDKVVCDWSMAFAIALTEEQLNALVDRIFIAQAPEIKVRQ
jgi:uncharacterized protein YpuA (DUF1002 family)